MATALRRMPKVEVRVLTEDYCEFVLSETDVSVANALRRVSCSALLPVGPQCQLLAW